jgi:hypothetical protein
LSSGNQRGSGQFIEFRKINDFLLRLINFAVVPVVSGDMLPWILARSIGGGRIAQHEHSLSTFDVERRHFDYQPVAVVLNVGVGGELIANDLSLRCGSSWGLPSHCFD